MNAQQRREAMAYGQAAAALAMFGAALGLGSVWIHPTAVAVLFLISGVVLVLLSVILFVVSQRVASSDRQEQP